VSCDDGRLFVDAQELPHMINGSPSFEKNRIILTLSGPNNSSSATKFRHKDSPAPFLKVAIEAMASIREWDGTLRPTVQNGYPTAKTTPGYTIAAYQARPAVALHL
jgi:hypothetical protein